MTSPKQLAERALELSKKATPGPWKEVKKSKDNDYYEGDIFGPERFDDWGNDSNISLWQASFKSGDVKFIAESRTLLPALATEVLKLLEETAVMREALVWLSPIGKYEKAHEPDRFIVGKVAREALAKADGIRNGEKQ